MNKLKIILLGLILISCDTDSGPLKTIFLFPQELKEISAVEMTTKSDLIWTLEDKGNEANLYAIDWKGKLVSTLSITDAVNNDWEDLTSDGEGNVYIGDFGNNDNERKDLCIYKVDAAQLNKSTTKIASKISFYFPEQKDFPPTKSGLFYDVEAFFILNNTFYLFTKNRSSQFDGTTLLYSVPNEIGNHRARFISSFKTCDVYKKCAITSADSSPDGKSIVLLSGASVWVFTDYKNDDFFSGKAHQIDLQHFSQKEGICFGKNNKIYISDERKKKSGGKLYELDLSKLKSKS